MTTPALKYTSKLAGKRVLVLGGTSGIGYGVAEAAIEHGAYVTVSSSNPEKVAAAVESLKSSYPPGTSGHTFHAPVGHVCDLSQSDKVEENIDSLLKVAAGDSKINHVAFTAGDMFKALPISEITVDDIRALGTVRFIGMIMLAKHLPRYMDLDPTNSFTLTGGVVTKKPRPGYAVLAAYGGAFEALARGLSLDLKPMRVNLVAPGAVSTPLFDSIPKDKLDEIVEVYKNATAVGQMGKIEDVAEAYIYLMKDPFVTGTVIDTNGGLF